MGRRKQQKPQANIGRIENRAVEEPSEPPAPPEAEEPEFDLEEWEEANAYTSRPRKRQKQASVPTIPQQLQLPGGTVVTPVVKAPQQLVFLELEIQLVGDIGVSSATLLQSQSLCFAPREDIIEVWSRGDNINPNSTHVGIIKMPSEDAAKCFKEATWSAGLSFGPLRPSSNAAQDTFEPSTSASASAASFLTCPVGLSPSTVDKRGAIDAEDARQVNGALTLVQFLQHMLPNGHRFDPGMDFPEDNAEIATSPLCSPRSKAAAAGPFSPSSPRGGNGDSSSHGFDASEIYAAVKPTGREPELNIHLPQLKPTLRGYQRRAAQWMVNREQGGEEEGKVPLHPLWREVPCIVQPEKRATTVPRCFYINIYSGLLSLQHFSSPPSPKGGIASDEMGLGKTVELLALIIANPYRGPAPDFSIEKNTGCKAQERIDCVCGHHSLNPSADKDYTGLWLQCSTCLAWQHGECVGHPRRAPKGDYVCQPCLRAQAAMQVRQPCGTTLIVCPTPILAQWRAEINRHVQPGALKVIVYQGQEQPKPGKPPPKVVTAADLAAADIVLTTYDVLRNDLYHSPDLDDSAAVRNLRRKRKYEILPTPLTRLQFWRVAIDEAQLVESSTAKAAAMALKLQTEHRWCVTGTPLSRGLEDLQGLMAFLKYEPFATKKWWKRVIQEPYEAGNRAARARLLALLRPALGGLLWRSAKADVKDELGIPSQRHHLTDLDFSAIERHFYARQHQDCVGAARTALSAETLSAAQAAAAAMLAADRAEQQLEEDEDKDVVMLSSSVEFEDRPLTQREEHKLLHPLVRLRQACVHPQVGAGGIRALSHTRTPMTMNEVLDTLISKARIEAEDAQRVLLASLNGLAGLLLLQGHTGEAVRAYREILKIIEENKVYIRADKLQQLHTLHNLAQVLAGPACGDSSIPRTLRDDKLLEEASALKNEYLRDAVLRLAACEAEVREIRQAAETEMKAFEQLAGREAAPALLSNWYIDATHLLVQHSANNGEHVAEQIKDQLAERDVYKWKTLQNAMTLVSKFSNIFGLQRVLTQEMKNLEQEQAKALEFFANLSREVENPSAELIELAARCGVCNDYLEAAGSMCKHCQLERKFTSWEARLFTITAYTVEAGADLSVEEAANRNFAQHNLHRIGRGGVGEDSGLNERVSGSRTGARTNIVQRPSEAEEILRMLQHQLKALPVPAAVKAQKDLLLAAAKTHLDGLESRRKEFIKLRAVAMAQRQKLLALDEIEMCVMRMQLRVPGEYVKPIDEIFKVYEAEIPVKSTELSADKAVAAAELRDKLGTLRYLQGVKEKEQRKAALGSPQKLGSSLKPAAAADGAEQQKEQDQEILAADPCPICQEALGRELCMLPCGHRLCYRCQVALVEQLPPNQSAASKRIGCPTCRNRVLVSEIAYIDAEKQDDEPIMGGSTAAGALVNGARPRVDDFSDVGAAERSIKVKGSYGTKLEAIIRRLFLITQSDATARVLVFSSWKDSLELVSHALTTNGLPHLYPKTGKKFEDAVAQFRMGHERQLAAAAALAAAVGPSSSSAAAAAAEPAVLGDDSSPRVLLLLLKQGGNGLNLQQAQHVVFIEPLLDPAEEAQAVGRVDRIGQTKTTHVHRFVIERSIEENVHKLGQHRAAAMDMSAAAVRRGKPAGERGALTLRDVAALLQEDAKAMGQDH